ncbi:MAG: TonB-dependent receptor [Cyclobacteriaceae bacterium]|nr:TonB-dependent receptor [Cyclobacteriaceae bacterium]
MKKSLLFVVSFLFLGAIAFAQKGAIKGQVLDENSLGMPGAAVHITELMQGTITDSRGNYEFYNVTEGEYEIVVSYLGYEDVAQKVTVASNQTASIKTPLEPGILLGDEILVLGDRLKGQAKALSQQKNLMNISNIVASDQIGRFPDANIGDALKRVPGITIQQDQGEARDIIIRGMAPQLNSVTINGERIPSAEGDNRRIQLDLIPSDMIQLIEVNKALTPDMDADAIGGSVNLLTRTVPNGTRISGTLGSGYNFLSNKPIWTGGLILGKRFFDDKLGAMLSGSYNYHDFGSDDIEAEWVDTDYGVLPGEFELRTYLVTRIRRSISLGLDYKFNENNTIYFSGMYNWRDDRENRFAYAAGDLEDAYDEGLISEISSGLYETEATLGRQTKAGIDNKRNKSARLEDQKMYTFSLRGDHLIGNKLKVNWSGTYSRASEERLNERYMTYESGGQSVILDVRDTRKPNVYPSESTNWQQLEFDEFTEENQWTYEEDLNGKIDLQLPVSNKGIFKFGGIYRSKNKVRDNDFYDIAPVGAQNDGDSHPVLGGSWDAEEEEYADLVMQDVTTEDMTKSDYLPGEKYQAGNFVSADFIGGLDLQDISLWEKELNPGEYIPANYNADEDISSAYAMLDYQLSAKFSTIVGLRVENTNIKYVGNAFDTEEETINVTTGSNSYSNWMPGVHVKYDVTHSTVLRAAWTNSLARPDYFKLVPFEEYNPDDQELVQGNPELKPAVAMNLDLMAENYFKSIGLVSGGVFYKNIDDFQYERVQNDIVHPVYGELDEFVTFANGGSAKIFGFEAALQRQLDFLPGFLKGFGVYLNYTYTSSEADGIVGRENETIGLPGTAKNMYNASLSYESEKLVLRASVNHASDYIDELGGDSFEDRYYDKQTFVDLNGSYAFSPNWRVFVEVNNLTNQPLRYYQGKPQYTMQDEYYNMRMNVGIKFDLFGN